MEIIVATGCDSVDAYEATVDNAKEILSWQSIPDDVTAFAKDKPTGYASPEVICKMVYKMTTLPEGQDVFRSKDGSIVILATKEAKTETVMYLFEKQIQADRLTAYAVKDMFDISALSWLAPFHGRPLVEDWVSDWGKRLQCINNDTWKEGATELQKVKYIITFINEMSRRGENYAVVKVNASAK